MRKYSIRELTPEDMMCAIGACPAVYEITPEDVMCLVGACPAVYEITPEDVTRVSANCSSTREIGNSYLIVGKKVESEDFGLESKVGEGEVLIVVPKKLIDEMEK